MILAALLLAWQGADRLNDNLSQVVPLLLIKNITKKKATARDTHIKTAMAKARKHKNQADPEVLTHRN